MKTVKTEENHHDDKEEKTHQKNFVNKSHFSLSPQVQIVYNTHRHQAIIIIITTIANRKASCHAIPEFHFQIQQPYWVRVDSCLQIQASKGSRVQEKLRLKQLPNLK
jgi:hypothetical protein